MLHAREVRVAISIKQSQRMTTDLLFSAINHVRARDEYIFGYRLCTPFTCKSVLPLMLMAAKTIPYQRPFRSSWPHWLISLTYCTTCLYIIAYCLCTYIKPADLTRMLSWLYVRGSVMSAKKLLHLMGFLLSKHTEDMPVMDYSIRVSYILIFSLACENMSSRWSHLISLKKSNPCLFNSLPSRTTIIPAFLLGCLYISPMNCVYSLHPIGYVVLFPSPEESAVALS